MYEKLPTELKEKARFCLWKHESNGKVPYQINGCKAKATDKKSFSDYKSVVDGLNGYDGIGIGIFDGLCAVDIDHCVEDGSLSETAQDIIKEMNSYTEYSPSGTGVRIIFKASNPSYDKKHYYINNRKLGLEIYVSGYTNRFVTITGNALNGNDVSKRDAELMRVLEKYMLKPNIEINNVNAPGSYLSDSSVISKASSSKQAEKFTALWSGNIPDGKSHSEADQALCNILAFWCGGDTEQMDRLFRKSKLMRDKWDREDYRTATLENAVLNTSEFYTPFIPSSAETDFDSVRSFLIDAEPENNNRYSWTDIGSGRLFADCYKAIARYVPERKSWYCYDKGIWSADAGNLRTMELCKELADTLLTYAITIHDERRRQDFLKYCSKWQSRRTRETILKDAQSIYPVSIKEFDCDKYAFNCLNGTLHLDTMEFTSHSAEDKLTKISEVAYNPQAKCDRFTLFINEITNGDVEKAKFLQKALGYSISGDTRYECLFILYGATTRNGKGTLCESVLKILGGYGCTAKPETISTKQHINSQTPSEDIARLAGIRFANISEPGKGLVLNAAQVKSMTGNDTLNARFLHENSFDFRPQFKLYINTNYLPVINDMTLFSSGRVIIIPFDRHFSESEQDKTLKAEFSKPENQSAILNWLVQGYQELMHEGLTPPSSVKNATLAYQHDSDKITQFAEDELIPDANAEERTSAVYERYKIWCVNHGHHAESMRNFKQSIMTFGNVVRKRPKAGGSETTILTGYKLVSEFI